MEIPLNQKEIQCSDVCRATWNEHKREMSDRDGVNDPPFFAFNQDAATDILTSAGSDVNNYKSAMQVGMPFSCMQFFTRDMNAS